MNALADLATSLSSRRVAVVGDVMLDHFMIGRVDRISPEAPVPVVRFEREDFRLGGAANVAHNIAALGATARLIGVVGDDEGAIQIAQEMRRASLSADGLVTDATRTTTRKTRIVTTRNQQVARVDQESDGDATGATMEALVARLETLAADAHAIVLSDYRKGVISPALIERAAAVAAARRLPLLVDPKVPQVDRYRGATLLTPNHHEAELMTQTSITSLDDARAAARAIHDRSGASVLITWGEHGMWMLDAAATPHVEAALPAVAREVADVTGAGDTVIAVLSLGLAAGAPLRDAARLATIAAGLVVARFGPAVLSLDELRQAIGDA